MGIYLVSVGAQEWFDDDEDEGGRGALASALGEELRRRGLPPYESVPEAADLVRGSGMSFEEKLVPPMDGFSALCRTHLSREEEEVLCGWSVLVPLSLDEEIWLPLGTAYTDATMVAGAPRVLGLAERLAAAVDLPVDEIPAACDNLDLTMWFLEGPAKDLAAARPGPWSEDLDAAFYVALYLRAAQHSLRRGCPMVYS
ncbi:MULTISPECIES: hypothetical protein [unclassified Streptomyces]|uniref:hypothetical protein n=1 Tax=unclassified Streptomyces TaxID=2593676 RepID=UPI0022508745|nr:MULTISPECIES: hypothetical protein [unclassified Streptomyces]MCX5052225.1 hypothetical protein [Streptomyces sp. NBC_00474]MCX5063973.1 hypothetical protein [Streptomyces sp. NBC_00452]MCX5251398.1 hypothetical protein [Streptomyces sp. NBC_00201]MCX5294678.1 hypothetical protein [Streptomyces sp. NBC_00183]